jgi:tRNA/tmRNA/rRNA uracil-C5-methylase (TrmA/RlmC/RlmD family)
MLGRVAGPDVKNRIMSPVSSPLSDGYRNKAVLHAQTERGCTVLGYFTENNTDVIDIDRCLLADEAINAELESRRRESGFFETLRDGMSVTFRHTSGDGVLMWRNKPPRNLSWLKENTCLGTFSFPADSFFQVNPKAQNLVISRALDFIKRDNPDNVLDLYCGCGIFTVAAALKVKCRAFGADCDPGSIEAAVYNAGKFGLDNCSFKALPAEKIVKTSCMDMPPGRNMLIVDPPRSGVSVNALRVLTGAGFDSIIYISCAPDTLCRDIKYFLEAGYEIFGSGIADMFPRTFHFESVTYLKRVK